MLPGAIAFRLHDTYGFPIDLTIELAAEYGVRVDLAGFQDALAEQRDRSRAGTKAALQSHAEVQSLYESIARRAGDSQFLGYETTTADGRVVAILRDGIEYEELTGSGAAEVVLDRTPFYAEGGGQVGDRGRLLEQGGGSDLFTVEDTQRPVGGLIVHRGRLHGRLRVGETITAEVDAERRAHTMRNHTGTHVLHRALRNTVGESARQAGSLVAPEYLRFDFPFDRPLTDEEKRRDRGRGPARGARGPAGLRAVHDDGRGDRGRRRRVLRREVRRAGADRPGQRLFPRAVRRHALPRVGTDRVVRDHGRALDRERDAPHRGAHGRGRRPAARRAERGAGADRVATRRAERRRGPGADRRAPGGVARDEAAAARRRGGRPQAAGRDRGRRPRDRPGRPVRRLRRAVRIDRRAQGCRARRARPPRRRDRGARPGCRRAADLRDRQRRPRRRVECLRAPWSRPRSPRSTGAVAGVRPWPRGRGRAARGWRARSRSSPSRPSRRSRRAGR